MLGRYTHLFPEKLIMTLDEMCGAFFCLIGLIAAIVVTIILDYGLLGIGLWAVGGFFGGWCFGVGVAHVITYIDSSKS